MRWLVLAVTLAGCTGQPRHSLAELADARVVATLMYVPSNDPYRANSFPDPLTSHVYVSVTSDDCASFAEDLHASLAGLDLTVEDSQAIDHPDPAVDDGPCIGAHVSAAIDSATYFASEPAVITLSDSTATWTISIPGLDDVVDVDLLAPGTTTTLTWQGGIPIRELFLLVAGPGGYTFAANPNLPDATPRLHDTSADVDLPADLVGPVDLELEIDSELIDLGTTPDAHGASCVGPTHCQGAATVYFYETGVPVASP